MKTTIEVHIWPGGPGRSIQKFVKQAFPLLYLIFFKSILLHKNWRGRGELLLKNVGLQKMVVPTNHATIPAGFTFS